MEAELEGLLPAAEEAPASLHRAMRYSVFAGGKRVRPGLVVLAGETFGVAREVLMPGAAAILQTIHVPAGGESYTITVSSGDSSDTISTCGRTSLSLPTNDPDETTPIFRSFSAPIDSMSANSRSL